MARLGGGHAGNVLPEMESTLVTRTTDNPFVGLNDANLGMPAAQPGKCTATTKAGNRCKNKARPGCATCGIHRPKAPPPDNRCTATTAKGTRCTRNQSQRGICHIHLNMLYEENYAAAVFAARALPTRQAVEQLIEAEVTAHRIGERQAFRFRAVLREWFPQAHAPPLRNQLHQIANDRQNVHTTQVSAQTTRTMDMLLAIPVSSVPTTVFQVLEHYLSRISAQSQSALASYCDVVDWYERKSCVETNDRLYKRLLDGCVAYINASPHKDELWVRLLQEIDESVGMCCMGHITRLCNTFVGFDERFAAPVPVGELLQQRMSAIAAKDIETDAKIVEATAVLNELNVPEDERAAWLDAF